MNAARGTAAIALCAWLAGAALGCKDEPAVTKTKPVGSAGTESKDDVTLPAPEPFGDVKIPEGTLDNRGFTLDFRVQRVLDDAGRTYDQAAGTCMAAGRMLCTETQWLRACRDHAALGRMESWTASRRNREAVVRGGKGCSTRRKVDGTDTHPRRIGLCCERAVALRASGDAGPWLGMGTRLPLRFERALNEGDERALKSLLADPVIREGREWTREALLARERDGRDEVRWTLFDLCRMRSGPVVVDKDGVKTGRRQGMILNCRTVLARKGDVIDYYTRLGLVKDEGGDAYRIAQIEHATPSVIPGAR